MPLAGRERIRQRPPQALREADLHGANFREADLRRAAQKYGDWILDVLEYDSADNLIKVLGEAVVRPALEMSQRLIAKKAAVIQTRHVNEYVARGQV